MGTYESILLLALGLFGAFGFFVVGELAAIRRTLARLERSMNNKDRP